MLNMFNYVVICFTAFSSDTNVNCFTVSYSATKIISTLQHAFDDVMDTISVTDG